MDEVLRGDFETRQDALAKAAHMTIAEKRQVENLPFIEGTDRIFLNTATLPLDAIDAKVAAEAAGADTVARTVQQLYLGVGKVITVEEAREIVNSVGGNLDPSAGPPPQTPAELLAEEELRTLMGRLGWQKSLTEVDPAALVDGMDGPAVAIVTEALTLASDIPHLKTLIKERSRA
jgi:hypothetical protein